MTPKTIQQTLALILLGSIVLFGCKKNEVETAMGGKMHKTLSDETMIPCADSVTLSAFDNDESVIHYKVARYYAYWEIENALSEPLGIEGDEYRLTAYPVIIYDYDSKPKYYEFGVIVNGSVVSSITTIAKKESSNIISFIFEEPLNYDDYGNYSYFVFARLFLQKDYSVKLLVVKERKRLVFPDYYGRKKRRNVRVEVFLKQDGIFW